MAGPKEWSITMRPTGVRMSGRSALGAIKLWGGTRGRNKEAKRIALDAVKFAEDSDEPPLEKLHDYTYAP